MRIELASESALTFAALLLLAHSAGPEAALVGQTKKPCLPAVGYYITARARLQHDELVYLLGNSNLPEGSILAANVSDFIGEGSKTVSEDATVTLGRTGVRGKHPPQEGTKVQEQHGVRCSFHAGLYSGLNPGPEGRRTARRGPGQPADESAGWDRVGKSIPLHDNRRLLNLCNTPTKVHCSRAASHLLREPS